MRFGIDVMHQIDLLIPRDATPGAIPSYVAQFDFPALVRKIAGHGFDPVELGGDLAMFMPPAFSPSTMASLAKLKQELALSYTVHLPLWSVEPSTPLAPVREGSVRAVTDIVRATLPLAPEVYVLHATGPLAAEFYRMQLPETVRPIFIAQFQSYAKESAQAILAETGLPSRKLAVETIEFPFDMTLQMADELDLSMCLDTGHVLSGFSGPIGLFEALERCLPRLAEIHLHDAPWQGPELNIQYGKDHQPLGTADLEVGRFLDRLKGANWSGPLILEMPIQSALASLDAIRQLRPEAITK